MKDNDVSVESVELALLSEIDLSSAMMMKNAYLPHQGENTVEDRGVSQLRPADSPHEEGLAGPNVLVYITKLASRTPPEVIEKILKKYRNGKTPAGTHDFYTVVLTVRIRLDDPSTTRFINGTIDVSFPPGMKILTYSPKEKGIITAIIGKGGDAISLSQDLEFGVPAVQGTTIHTDPRKHRFGIIVGPDEKIAGTYTKKTGYTLDIPAGILLEYQGMLKNEHEMFWEIFPPMPGQDIEISGNERQAVFSLIVQAPKNPALTITAYIEGRVKGNLWGVIPLKGSVVL
jgi:hypothetical protein